MTGMPIKIYENLDEKQCNAVGDEGEVNTQCQEAYPHGVINEEGRRNNNFECLRGDERRSYSRVLLRECHPWSLECVIGQMLSTFVLRVLGFC